jgi:hypothetical protein
LPTDSSLAQAIVKHAVTLSVSGLKNIVDNWKWEQVVYKI